MPNNQIIGELDEELESLKPVDEELESLKPVDVVDEELESLKPVDEELESLKPVDEELESLKPVGVVDEELESLKPAKGENPLYAKLDLAEEERKEILAQIEKNEKAEAQIAEMEKAGASPESIEKFKQESGYQEGSWLKGFGETLGRLSQTESSFPIDIERAKQPEQGFFSPLKMFESAVGDVVGSIKEGRVPSPSKWFELDRGVRERVKETLRRPIRDELGRIDFEALQTSNLSRKEQNELVLDYAQNKTGIPRKVWAEILEKRFGVREDDGSLNTTAKRAAQAIDSFLFNLPSRGLARAGSDSPVDRVKALKKVSPLIPITVTRTDEGKFYTQDGVEIEDADADDTETELKQKGWEATVDTMIGTVESQAMENWSQFGDVLLAATGAGLVKGVGAGLAKAGMKSAGKRIVKGASRVQAITGQVGETMLRAARQGKRIGAAEQAGSLGLKVFRAIDRTVSPIATTALLSAAGAPETQELATGVGAGLMATGFKAAAVPLNRIVDANNPFSAMARDEKALKAIMRTEDYKKLPKYVKNYFDKNANGSTYEAFRAKAGDFLQIHQDLSRTMKRWVDGDVDDSAINAYYDALANDEKARGVLDYLSVLSDPAKGLTPEGRFRSNLMRDLVDATTHHLEERKAEARAGATPDLQDHMYMLKALRDRFKDAVADIPREKLNGSKEDFMNYVRGLGGEETGPGRKLAYMGDEIESMLELTQKSDPYKLFAGDLMKLYAIVADSDTPMSFRNMLGYIQNAPELAKNLDVMAKRSAAKLTVNPFTGSIIERVHPEATARKLYDTPEGIMETIRLGQETVGAKLELEQDLREARNLPEQLRAAQRDYEERIANLRMKTSLNRTQLEGEVDRAINKSDRHMANAVNASTELRNTTSRLKKEDVAGAKRIVFAADKILKRQMLSNTEVNALPKEAQSVARKANYELKTSDAAIRRAQNASQTLATLEQRLYDAEALRQDMMTKDVAMNLKQGPAGILAGLLKSLPILNRPGLERLKGSKYMQNVLALIAKDVAAGAKDGTFSVNEKHIALLRLLEDARKHEKLLGLKLEPQHQRALRAEILALTDSLHSMSEHTELWKIEVEKLRELTKNQKENVSAIARQIEFMRDGFRVAKLSREIQQKSASLYAIAEKLIEGKKTLGHKEVRQLVWFAKSTMVERMRMAKDPSWIVTYRGEVDSIFKALKENIPGLNDRAIELVSRATGADPTSLDGTIITSWFINPGSGYDGPGRLRFSLAMADYWHNQRLGLWESGGAGEALRQTMSQEMLSTILGRDTAMSVGRDVQLAEAMKRKAISDAKRLFSGYIREMEELKTGGKSFQFFSTRPAFVSILKRLQGGMKGFSKNHYLVLDGQLTENGQIVMAWAKAGFTDTVLDKLIAARYDERLATAEPQNLPMLREQMNTLKNDLKTYLPNPSSNYLGESRDVTALDYEMAFKALKVHQKWDRKKLEVRNSMNAAQNVKDGTKIPSIAYFPHRIDAGTQLLVQLALTKDNLDHPAMHTQLFGRMVTSSIEGQVAKAQGVLKEADIRHPMETFFLDTVSLFQAVTTREPVKRLHFAVKLLNLGGHEYAANAILAHFMQADVIAKSNRMMEGLRLIDGVHNRKYVGIPTHILGAVLNPMIRLATPLKTVVENPIQSGLTGMVANPTRAYRELGYLGLFYPQFMKDFLVRTLGYLRVGNYPKPEDLKTFYRVFSSLSPEYVKELSIISEAMNSEANVKAERGLARLEWQNNGFFKKMDVHAGDKVAAVYAAEMSLFKENSERAVQDIRLSTAASIWRGVTEDLMDMKREGKDRPELIRHALGAFAGEFRGALEDSTMAYKFAAEMADGVLAGTPLAGFRGFAVTFVNSKVGRFDTGNLPAMMKTLARWRPGATRFFNPMSTGIYRLGLAMHGLMGKRGAAASDVTAAAASVACAMGAAAAGAYAASVYALPWFTRLSPVAGVESTYNLVTDPATGLGSMLNTLPVALSEGTGSRGGGDLVLRALLTTIGQAAAWVSAEFFAAEDGTTDLAAHEREQTERISTMLNIVYEAGPTVILTDSMFNIPRWGWAWYDRDLAEMGDAVAEVLNRPDIPDADKSSILKGLQSLESGMQTIIPMIHHENFTEEQITKAYSSLGVNVPGSVVQKMTKALEERRLREERRGASALEPNINKKK